MHRPARFRAGRRPEGRCSPGLPTSGLGGDLAKVCVYPAQVLTMGNLVQAFYSAPWTSGVLTLALFEVSQDSLGPLEA